MCVCIEYIFYFIIYINNYYYVNVYGVEHFSFNFLNKFNIHIFSLVTNIYRNAYWHVQLCGVLHEIKVCLIALPTFGQDGGDLVPDSAL